MCAARIPFGAVDRRFTHHRVMSSDAIAIGPTGWPERTLFFDVAEWSYDYLRQPDGPEAGEPFVFTDQQARILAWWFALDATGRWLFRRGTLRMMKGWGKDPYAAVLAAVELCGPCRFGGWNDDGSPRAIEHTSPWVQVVAVSRDQTRTTMRLFPGLFSDDAKQRYAIDVNKEIIYARGGTAVIEAVTSSPLALEGGRTTLTIRNEVQNWQASNRGHEMSEVIDGNLAKSRDGAARALSLCNAHVPGEDSVGEREWDAWRAIQEGRTRTSDVLYAAVEAPPGTRLDDETSLRAGITAARVDSTWLDVDRLIAEVWDPKTSPSAARRKYLNQIIAAEDAWIAPHQWDALADAELRLSDGELITLGFDGSISDDHSGLVATRVPDGAWFTLGVWDPERFGGEAPREEIDARVRWAHEMFDVVGFYSDLHPFESYVDSWARDLSEDYCIGATTRHPVAWDMRTRNREFTLNGAMRIHNEITEQRFRHDGDLRARAHVHNARRRPNQWGVSFGKETRDSKRKIDALPAGTLSRMARHDYLALPKSKQRRKRTGRAAFF